MKFFLPFWFSDHVHASYDPWDWNWSPEKDKRRYVWQLDWPRLPVDGILISRFNIDQNKSHLNSFHERGVYQTLEIPSGIPTFGDCGAWGYIRERVPPYAPLEMLEFYRKMKFSYACTIDHIILPETFSERYERLKITLRNAEMMIEMWNEEPKFYGFELVGVAQGWDPESYYDSARQLIEMGFKFIALGGQARSPSKLTVEILKRCHPLWRDNEVKVHIFGLGRWTLFEYFAKYGIYSFDNAYHRRAWLSTSQNYELNGDRYTAVRIPIAKEQSARVLEKKVLDKLGEVDRGIASVRSFLDLLKEYDPERYGLLSNEYERTLQDRPWERCNCIICSQMGVHVIIFRSNERNMRRGFHNLWNLSERLGSTRRASVLQQLTLA